MANCQVVLVTGGAGYVGSRLVPKLLAAGYVVRVLNSVFFDNGLSLLLNHPNLQFFYGDIRDEELVGQLLRDAAVVVHLAAVANDPSFSCDPDVARSINMDCLPYLMRTAKNLGCRRFIYASSASVYGVSDKPVVDETHCCVPLTDYNVYKAQGENILYELEAPSFETIAVRAATVCGWSPRQRFDLTVNVLTARALKCGEINVFGGTQFRPNIHIDDLARLYMLLVGCESFGAARGAAVNAGYENFTVADIAVQVKAVVDIYVGGDVSINTVASEDLRSYRLDSRKIQSLFGFQCAYTIRDAVLEICDKWHAGWFDNSDDVMTDARYHNVLNMKQKDWQMPRG